MYKYSPKGSRYRDELQENFRNVWPNHTTIRCFEYDCALQGHLLNPENEQRLSLKHLGGFLGTVICTVKQCTKGSKYRDLFVLYFRVVWPKHTTIRCFEYDCALQGRVLTTYNEQSSSLKHLFEGCLGSVIRTNIAQMARDIVIDLRSIFGMCGLTTRQKGASNMIALCKGVFLTHKMNSVYLLSTLEVALVAIFVQT